MARKLRVEYPGAIYHPLALREAHSATSVMNRSDRREPLRHILIPSRVVPGY